ncbi:hypothetical protein BDW02DRAFT_353543 [Decorospora gaudefroyi]|uniref:Extracellular mutant protein 11 C-terminal domain-containing protein n=1 Tax=Decorospora gaudefroyi TaxID=184978 RepID=A0A6A5KF05_9PLEO|nr:hypothetical protein BDW02DRAFT_353543 [Decorospora gaudefroyi]
MQGFINQRHRVGSPQNAQPQVKPERRAAAANARVSMKNGPIAQQAQNQAAIPSRGLGNAQNSSAIMQQAPQRRHSGQAHGQKHDPYDTDAASLDTTVDQSVIQVKHNQKKDQQGGQQHDLEVDHSGDSDEEEIEYEVEESDEAHEQVHEQQYPDCNDHVFTHDENQYLEEQGAQNFSREKKLGLLGLIELQLGTVDGDSYPTTTNGEPSEWGGTQEPPSQHYDDRGPVSPSPQRQHIDSQSARPFAPQPPQQQQKPNIPAPTHSMQLFQQSATIRGQQRSSAPLGQLGEQNFQHNIAALPSSQLPTYSQANPNVTPALPLHSSTRPNSHGLASKPSQAVQRQSVGASRVQFQPINRKLAEPPAHSKHPSSARSRPEPMAQQHSVEPAPEEEVEAAPYGDYDHDTLLGMKYKDLKNEDFDTDPHARPRVLAEEDLRKPLVERLELVQKTLVVDQQSDFFRSLPTTEWEDAGDWFLDKFQSIIRRTKEARQSKRKLAREFEDEVEKRHKHVSKKQCQVEQAMDKMKAQGEGLVPRSPRPSKSPRPKRG